MARCVARLFERCPCDDARRHVLTPRANARRRLGRAEVRDHRHKTSKARDGTRERAALEFALEILRDRGAVSDDSLQRVRAAGYTDGEIAEIVAHVALNVFTNYFNLVAQTTVDFPTAPSLAVA